MKLLRVGPPGQEKPALLNQDGNFRDLSNHIDDISGPHLEATQLKDLARLDTAI